jgi:hypothetical protein
LRGEQPIESVARALKYRSVAVTLAGLVFLDQLVFFPGSRVPFDQHMMA